MFPEQVTENRQLTFSHRWWWIFKSCGFEYDMSTGKQGRWQRVRTPEKKIDAPLAKADRLKINRKNYQLQSDLGLVSMC